MNECEMTCVNCLFSTAVEIVMANKLGFLEILSYEQWEGLDFPEYEEAHVYCILQPKWKLISKFVHLSDRPDILRDPFFHKCGSGLWKSEKWENEPGSILRFWDAEDVWIKD